MSGLRVITCASFRRGEPDGQHDLAAGWRGGRAQVRDAVAALLLGGLAREAPELAAADGVTLVPMAGHRVGGASDPAVRLAEVFAAAHPGWPVVEALHRVAGVAPGMDGGPRDPEAEASSLRWGAVPGVGPVLLVDDVVHTGATIQAAWLAAPRPLRARLVALAAFRAED